MVEEEVIAALLRVGFASCFKDVEKHRSAYEEALGIFPGQQTALTKQQFDELSANESETYGFNFP